MFSPPSLLPLKCRASPRHSAQSATRLNLPKELPLQIASQYSSGRRANATARTRPISKLVAKNGAAPSSPHVNIPKMKSRFPLLGLPPTHLWSLLPSLVALRAEFLPYHSLLLELPALSWDIAAAALPASLSCVAPPFPFTSERFPLLASFIRFIINIKRRSFDRRSFLPN